MIIWIAADCLGQIGPEARDAVPELQRALRRPYKIGLIRKGVALALQRITGQANAEGASPDEPPSVTNPQENLR
jgi:hypothetical protein